MSKPLFSFDDEDEEEERVRNDLEGVKSQVLEMKEML